MVNPKRNKQISEQVQREIASYILRLSFQPLFKGVTIVGAEVSPDLSVAKIFYSLFDSSKAAETAGLLQSKAGEIRHALAKNLNLRNTPRLNFIYDNSTIEAQKLSALIDKAIESDQKLHHKNDNE